MENKANWHHKVPSQEQLQQALEELNAKLEKKTNEHYSL
jgi:hypothetical protein